MLCSMSNDLSKFGFRLDCGSAFEPIWPGAAPYPFPATAVAVEVVAGGDAADDAAGTGARTVRVEGVDGSFTPHVCDLSLNGVLASAPSALLFLRVNRAFLLTAGALEVNVADVQIGQVGGDVLAVIPADYGQTQQAIVVVPAGWKLRIANARTYSERLATKTVDTRLVVRRGIDGAEPTRRTHFVAFGLEGPDDPATYRGGWLYGPADVWLEARGASTPDVVGRFEGDLRRV